jgi:hypothetical protein
VGGVSITLMRNQVLFMQVKFVEANDITDEEHESYVNKTCCFSKFVLWGLTID